MSIYFGNLSIPQIEQRTGIEFPQELKNYMESRQQSAVANIQTGESIPIQKDRWHCFDIPFILVCGDIEIANKIYGDLKKFSSKFKEQLQIAIDNS
jgi:hypothetical protein